MTLQKTAQTLGITDTFKSLFTGFTNEIESVFHFTNIANAQKIVGNSTLRFTPLGASNDISELALAYKIIKDVINQETPKEFSNQVLQYMEDHTWRFMSFSMCRASIVKATNDVTLWAAYGGDGDGCCLEIMIHELFEIVCNKYPGSAILLPVDYDESAFRQKIAKHFSKIYDSWKNGNLEEKAQILNIAGNQAINLGAFYKNKCFEFESEIRIVLMNWKPSELLYFDRGSNCLPYIEVDIRNKDAKLDTFIGRQWGRMSPIRSVVVGPSRKQDIWEIYMQLAFMKAEAGCYQKRVGRSELPYRSK